MSGNGGISAVQETLGTDIRGYAVRDVSGSTSRRSEPADIPAVGWSEDEIDYLADSGLTVPGQGTRSPGCGDYLPLKFCPSCGEPHMMEKRCKQRTCPSCSVIWMGEAAERATVRLQAAREAAESDWDRRLVHVVVSPPEGEIRTTGDYERGARRAHELAREHGVRGGVLIPHGYRVTERAKDEFEDENPEMGIWRWILTERVGDWRGATYFSPHYHVVGLARDVEASSPESDGGWVVKRIRSLERYERTSRESFEDVYGLLYYLLTHTSFDPASSSHVLRWFGELSYRSFSPESAVSDRILERIERLTREVREDKGFTPEEHVCHEDGCEGLLRPTARNAWDELDDPEWCDRVGRRQTRRLRAAAEWLSGEIHPPPGLRHPATREDALEALSVMCENRW